MKHKRIILIIVIVFIIFFVFRSCSMNSHIPKKVEFSYEEKNNRIYLTMKSEDNYHIYYTLDGSIPDKNSTLYTDTIELNRYSSPDHLSLKENNDKMFDRGVYQDGYISGIFIDDRLPRGIVVRAVAIAPNQVKGDIKTKTFFVKNSEIYDQVPIISIVTDPSNLTDYHKGIMVKGYKFDEWAKTQDSLDFFDRNIAYGVVGNFTQKGREWERDAVLEYFENGTSLWNKEAGIRIKGGVSRLYGQKSFNVYFRDEYSGKLQFELLKNATDIDQNVISKYKSFSLRNGGNDTDRLKFKDAWLQDIVSDRSVDIQNSKMVVVFINGEYWGVYNLQEKYSDYYYSTHYHVDKDNLLVVKEGDLLEGDYVDLNQYSELMSYANKDLTDETIYQEFLQLIDLQSMLDFHAIEVYIGNNDWGNTELARDKNMILWKTKTIENDSYGDGRWRWSLYDLEHSSALYDQEELKPLYCSVQMALEKNPLFASAMKNKEFRSLFYKTLEDLRYHYFNPDNVTSTLEQYYQEWEFYMTDYYRRFGDKQELREKSLKDLEDYFFKRYYSYNCC